MIGAIAVAIAVTGCQSSQQLIDPKLSLKQKNQSPQFIENVALNGSTTNIHTTAAADHFAEKNNTNAVAAHSFTHLLQQKYAEVLRVVPRAISNLPLYNFIEDWYGVRYRMGGNDKSGIDCSAFVQRVYENVFCTNLFRTALEQFKMCKMVFNKDSLKEGDLVFFHTGRKGRRISHVGIYLVNNFFVHASSTQGVVISSLDEAYWSRYFAGAGKVLDKQNSF